MEERREKVRSWSRGELDGLLPVNKEAGPTSHDTVNELRNILGYRRVGHTGTLDPQASGLLLLCLGKGCKIVQFFSGWDKEYQAEVKLGEETDTYDAQGQILKAENHLELNKDQIRKAILSFQGESWQIPPPYSALKFKGKKLYQYAREGKSVPRKPRKIEIKQIDVTEINLPFVQMKVVCTSGTYIRALAHDIGKKLSCGAHLSSLCRTRVGPFELGQALTFGELKADRARVSDFLVSIEEVFNGTASLRVRNDHRDKIKNGMELKSCYLGPIEKKFAKGERLTLKDEEGNVLAVGVALVSSEMIFPDEDENRIFEYKRVLV